MRIACDHGLAETRARSHGQVHGERRRLGFRAGVIGVREAARGIPRDSIASDLARIETGTTRYALSWNSRLRNRLFTRRGIASVFAREINPTIAARFIDRDALDTRFRAEITSPD